MARTRSYGHPVSSRETRDLGISFLLKNFFYFWVPWVLLLCMGFSQAAVREGYALVVVRRLHIMAASLVEHRL